MQKLKKCIIYIVFLFILFLNHSIASSSLDDAELITAQDQKMRRLFKKNKRTVHNLSIEMASDAWAFNTFMRETLVLLKNETQEDLLNGILRCIAFLLETGTFEEDHYYSEHKNQLEKLSVHSDPLARQTACIVRATLLRKSEKYTTNQAGLFEATETFLGEGKSSTYLYLRYKSYLTLAQTAEACRNREQAYSVIQAAFDALPETYNLKLHMFLVNLTSPDPSTEKDYVKHRRFSAEVLRNEGSPKQKVTAMFALALSYREPSLKGTEFYAPAKTAEMHNSLYKMSLEEHSKFNTDGLIHDLTSFDYLATFSKLAFFYKYYGSGITDLYRAIDIYKILQSYPQHEENSFENIIDIYRRGPLTIRSPLTALDMWKNRLAGARGSPHYLQRLQGIAEFCKNTGFYGEESFYRLQLVSLLKGQPEHQLWELDLALQVSCRIDAKAERFLEIRNIAQSFLNIRLSSALYIKALRILSEVYKRYPRFASPGEIAHIHNEIARSIPTIDDDEMLDYEQ